MSTTNDWMVQSILFYDAEEKAYSMSKQGSKECHNDLRFCNTYR